MGTQSHKTIGGANMKSFTIAAVVCLAASTSGAPQFFGNFGQSIFSFTPARQSNNFNSFGASQSNNFNSFGIPETGDHIINTNQGPTWNTKFGKLPFSGKNLMSRLETNRPSPQDVNNLLKLSRDLARNSPKGQFQIPVGGLGFGGFGIDDIESMGLPETGDVIKTVNGVPNIKTKFGLFPLSDTTLMTEAERQQFLPAVRTFTNILQKDNISVDDMNLLLQQSRDLTNALKQSGQDGIFGAGFGGLGDPNTP